MKATIAQLATYIERDGATVKCNADGSQTVSYSSKLVSSSWTVPSPLVRDLNNERDIVYADLMRKARAKAAR